MKFIRHKLGTLSLNVTDGEHGTVVNDVNGKYFLLSNKNIKNGKIVYNDLDRKINKDSFQKINKRTKLEYDDVVIATVGSIGRTAIIKDAVVNYDFQRSVGIYKVDKSVLLPEYLHYYFQLSYVQKRLVNLSTGAVQKCLFIADLKNIDIDIPEKYSYQKQLTKVLSDLDAKIELNNKINAELEAMAKLIYDYWFVQFDFPDENGKPYKSSGGKMVYNEELKREIPEGWEVERLDEIAILKAGGDKPKDLSPIKTDKYSIPIYSNGVKDEGLYGYAKKSKINSPSITVSARGTIGYSVLRLNPFVPIIRLISITPKNSNVLKFLHERIKMLEYDDSGSVQKQLTVPQISKLKVVVPKSDLLKKYHLMVFVSIQKVENNKIENQKLSELRDWLLPMLMNGQVRVGE